MLSKFAKSFLLTVSLLLCLAAQDRVNLTFAAAQATAQSTSVQQNTKDDGTSNWTWNHTESDKGLRIKVRINGQVEFNDDYTEITRISGGGSISILEERNGVSRKFEATPLPDGSLKRSFFMQDQSHAFDQEAREWLTRMLLETVRQSGYDAKPRVRRILQQRGANGVLEEITQIRSDYAKRIYFVELLNAAELDAATAQRVIRQATREVSSDYEKAQILTKAGEKYLTNEAIRASYLEGVNTISSDYEKARVLQTLLEKGNFSKETVRQIIKATSLISSDYEKTRVLMKVASIAGDDEGTINALLEASRSVQSDYEKARLLLQAAELSLNNNATRTAYLERVRTISSDYEKGRVLQALVKQKGINREMLLQIIKLSSAISSDYEQANLLIKAAAASSGDEAVRNAIVEASKSIASEHERGRVLNSVFK
jgi:hypothetical protein